MYVCMHLFIFKEQPAYDAWPLLVSSDASATSELKETCKFQPSGFAKTFVQKITSYTLFPENLKRELSGEKYSPKQYKSICLEYLFQGRENVVSM